MPDEAILRIQIADPGSTGAGGAGTVGAQTGGGGTPFTFPIPLPVIAGVVSPLPLPVSSFIVSPLPLPVTFDPLLLGQQTAPPAIVNLPLPLPVSAFIVSPLPLPVTLDPSSLNIPGEEPEHTLKPIPVFIIAPLPLPVSIASGSTGIAGRTGGIGSFAQAIDRSIAALSQFAQVLVSPATNPSVFVQATGSAISSLGNAAAAVVPELAPLGIAAAAATHALGGLMSAADRAAEHYAPFSPQLAQAEAQAQIAQIIGDMRRAQQAAPELTSYVQARTEVQQKIEDVKVRLLTRALPLIEAGMKYVGDLLPLVEAITKGLLLIAELNGAVRDEAKAIRRRVEEGEKPDPFENPTDLIRQGYTFDEARGVSTRRGVQVPRE